MCFQVEGSVDELFVENLFFFSIFYFDIKENFVLVIPFLVFSNAV